MPLTQDYAATFRATATGTVCVTSANAAIKGVLFWGSGTGSLHVFAGVTSTLTASATLLAKIVAYPTVAGATANAAVYYSFPAYASGGITLVIGPSADPKITLFWNPAGGA